MDQWIVLSTWLVGTQSPARFFRDVVIQTDGKILAAGDYIVRYKSNGEMDSSFGVNGFSLAGYHRGKSIALQDDGKIIILKGCLCNYPCGGGNFSCYRMNNDGSLDSTFAQNGTFNFSYSNPYESSGATDIALLSNGYIVMSGFEGSNDGSCYSTCSSIILDKNGNNNWGYSGLLNNIDMPFEMAVITKGSFFYILSTTNNTYYSEVVKTVHINNAVGESSVPLYGISTPYDFKMQSDQKIVYTGWNDTLSDFVLGRCGPDSIFGNNGVVTTNMGSPSISKSLAFQPDGKIVVVGCTQTQFALARYTNCGSVPNVVPPCQGGCSGSIAMVDPFGTAPFTYTWSTGDTIPALDSLCAGIYSVTITDSVGCASSYDFDLNVLPVTGINTTEPTCFNSCDASATAVSLNGVYPLTYLWNTGDTTEKIENLCSGIYFVAITDSNQCISSHSVFIPPPNQLIAASTSVYHPSCSGCTDGSIVFQYSGGTAPYNISWVPSVGSAAGDSIYDLPSGIYTVTITDVNGCSFSFIDTLVDQPDVIHKVNGGIQFEITPNPSQGFVEIKTSAKGSVEVELYDLLGNKIFHSVLVTGINFLNLVELTAGWYFVKLKNEEGYAIQKLIIE